MAFKKGEGGRPEGAKNRTTVAAKEAFTFAFNELGGYKAMVKWAKAEPDNMKVFYTLYARLIPTDLTSGGEKFGTEVILPHVGE